MTVYDMRELMHANRSMVSVFVRRELQQVLLSAEAADPGEATGALVDGLAGLFVPDFAAVVRQVGHIAGELGLAEDSNLSACSHRQPVKLQPIMSHETV